MVEGETVVESRKLGAVLGGLAAACGFAALASRPNDSQKPVLLRPPGTTSERDFLSRCIRCGLCVQACPPKVILVAPQNYGNQVGTPYIDAANGACVLCEGFPCVKACPTGALRDVEETKDCKMGIAIVDRDLCIALEGNRCEVCYRVCPLIDEAITLELVKRPKDDIHTIFEPVVNPEKCVGCGLCEERCVIREPGVAIRIKPSSIKNYY